MFNITVHTARRSDGSVQNTAFWALVVIDFWRWRLNEGLSQTFLQHSSTMKLAYNSTVH